MRNKITLIWLLLRKGHDPTGVATFLELHRALKGCDRVLDVGCGSASGLQHFGCKRLTGIEFFLPDLETAKKNRTHHELVHGDVRNLDELFQAGQFDGSVALDLIEHLTKEEGMKLIRSMDRISSGRIVLFTPNGFLKQGNAEKGDFQAHYSGWTANEMKTLGFSVTGMLGPKFLRGEYHKLRWRPKFFWGIVSLLAHFLWTRWQPSKAAAILCIKIKHR